MLIRVRVSLIINDCVYHGCPLFNMKRQREANLSHSLGGGVDPPLPQNSVLSNFLALHGARESHFV